MVSLHEKWSVALIRLSESTFSILSLCFTIQENERENENSGLASQTRREINEFDSCQIDLSLAKLNFGSDIFRSDRFWCANLWSFFYFKPERISKTLSILLLSTWRIHKIVVFGCFVHRKGPLNSAISYWVIGNTQNIYSIYMYCIHPYFRIEFMLFYRIDPCSLFYVTHNYIFYDIVYPSRF